MGCTHHAARSGPHEGDRKIMHRRLPHRLTFTLLGRPMATDRYHMRAYEARRRGALATDSSLKADLELIARKWLADEWAVIPFQPFHFFSKEATLTLKPRLSRGFCCPAQIHESRSGTGASYPSRPAHGRTKGAHRSPALNSRAHASRGPSLAGCEVNAPSARRKSPHIREALRADPRSVAARIVRVGDQPRPARIAWTSRGATTHMGERRVMTDTILAKTRSCT